MQPVFGVKAGSRVALNCQREIAVACLEGADILFVEYSGCGNTIPELRETAMSHARTFFVEKDEDDGSDRIQSTIRKHNLKSSHIKVIGVNTDCCVYRTVQGLTARLPMSTIEVVADACDSDFSHINGLAKIASLGGVRISNQGTIQ